MNTMPAQKPGNSFQSYGTPDDFIAAVKTSLGITQFDIDLAATEENKIAPLYFDEAMNSLTQSWANFGGWNWLNPPFAKIGPWVQRAYEQTRDSQARTAVLVPASVGSNWWRDSVHEKAAVSFLNGRLQFKGAEGLYPKDCALLLYEPDAYPGYHVWTWK